MKKIQLILMVLVLSLSVIACGKDADNNPSKKNDKETKSNDVSTEILDADDSSKNNDEDTEIKGVSTEILDASKFDPVIQIGKTILHIPFTFQDVLDAGATLQDNKYTPEYIMNTGDEILTKFSFGDGEIVMTFHNTSDTACSLKDAEVLASMGYSIETNSSSIYFAGGVHVGNTLSEFQDAWGAADAERSSNSYFNYTYYNYPNNEMYMEGDCYNVQIDRNTAKVTTIGMTYTPKLDKVIDTTYSYRHNKKDIDLIVPIPYYAYYVSFVCHYTVESIDGADYVISYPAAADIWDFSYGNVDYSPTVEALNSVLTVSEYVSITDPIEHTVILKNDENLGIICAFYNSSETGKYTCRTYVLGREVEFCTYFETSVYTSNGETISENAKQYFIDCMTENMSGCDYIIK